MTRGLEPLNVSSCLQDSNPGQGCSAAKREHTRPHVLFEPLVDNSNSPFWPDFRHLEGIATDLAPGSQPEPAQSLSVADVSPGSAIQSKLARHAAQLSTDNGGITKATCALHEHLYRFVSAGSS